MTDTRTPPVDREGMELSAEVQEELQRLAKYVIARGGHAHDLLRALHSTFALGVSEERARIEATINERANAGNILSNCRQCGQFRGHGHECAALSSSAPQEPVCADCGNPRLSPNHLEGWVPGSGRFWHKFKDTV